MGYRSSTGKTYRDRPPPLPSATGSPPPRLPMRRLALLSFALVGLAVTGAVPGAAQTAGPADDRPLATTGRDGTSSPAGGQAAAVTATDAEITRLQEEAEALSGRYFETLGRLAELQRRIDDIEARIPALADEVAGLRARTRDRAVAAYQRAGADLTAVIGADDPLEAARRVHWLDRLNARDDALADRLRTTTARLTARRAELRTARDDGAAALDAVLREGQEIDALLTDAQARRQAALVPTGADADPADGSPTTAVPPASSAAPPASPTTPAPLAPGPAAPPAPPSAPPSPPPPAPPTYTPTPGTHPAHDEPFLVCTRTREASGRYGAYNPAGPYMGAYQFLQTTWNSTANHAGRPELIGVPPHTASPYDQDDMAWALYRWRGSGPWGGACDPG